MGDHRAWSESYYFNFVDPDQEIGAFTRMGFRANDGWADALHAVYLPGGRVAFTYGRRTDLTPELVGSMGDADPVVGDLVLRRGEPFERWSIVYVGEAAVMDDPTAMLLPTRDRPEGWSTVTPLTMDVGFEALGPPHSATGGTQGHFEQTGRVRGTIHLGDDEWTVDGHGVRDKSWGPRTWQAPSGATTQGSEPRPGLAGVTSGLFLNWFSMNFGPDLALGGACGRAPDGSFTGKGWIQRNGDTLDLDRVMMTTELDPENPLLHRSVHLQAVDADGTAIAVDGTVLTICPTKIPRRDGVTFVNEGLARFETDGRTGYGIAEHWFSIPR